MVKCEAPGVAAGPVRVVLTKRAIFDLMRGDFFGKAEFRLGHVAPPPSLGLTPERTAPADTRLAEAAEYAAYQLGQINQKLDRLTAAVERLAGGQPDPRPFSQIKQERQAKRGGA